MKVRFKNLVMGYTGKCDGLVYYWSPRLNRTLVRRHTPQRITAQNRRFSVVGKNLAALGLSIGYKSDLAVYVDIFNNRAVNRDKQFLNWYNAFTKLMYAQGKADPSLDLATITKDEIHAKDLPCKSVKTAVEAGFLAEVRDYQILKCEM
ncbi:MAG: hypothetical protein Q8M98_02960 [Candidatus Cloacimonadaceae bacterium]|nr:hypothetical protein [Candidatus Cloacimonadaceae bacterium]MDP3113714.1 hypothetical protein [Candidatus Cloacimonadaceae bacterium]